MSNRLKAALAIQKQKLATLDDLCDQITEWNRKKIIDTVKDLCKVGIASRQRDDVTGLPAYSLTNYGKQWLAEQPTSKEKSSVSQAVSGDVTTADKHRPTVVDGGTKRADPPAEGLSDVEAGTQDEMPADPASGEMPTDKACCNAAKVVATTAGSEVAELREQLAALEQTNQALQRNLKAKSDAAQLAIMQTDKMSEQIIGFCEWIGHKHGVRIPMNLGECKDIIQDWSDATAKIIAAKPSTATRGVVIKPCVFCGHDAIEIDEVGMGEFVVACPECKSIGPQGGSAMEAISSWNDRKLQEAA